MNAVAEEKLADVYDVHYRNENTAGTWFRWMSAPKRDKQECYKWIRQYGKPMILAGIIRIPGEDCETEFRIVKCERTVIEAVTA